MSSRRLHSCEWAIAAAAAAPIAGFYVIQCCMIVVNKASTRGPGSRQGLFSVARARVFASVGGGGGAVVVRA